MPISTKQLEAIQHHLAAMGSKANRPDYVTNIATSDLSGLLELANVARRIKQNWRDDQGVQLETLRELCGALVDE